MSAFPRRTLLAGGAALAAAATVPSVAAAEPRPSQVHIDRTRIRRWAADTWASLVAMTDERTGLTADNIDGPIGRPNRSGYTSPTNIGGYLWSAIVARELRLISRTECSLRIAQTLLTLRRMERHRPSGMYYNWYDERSGAVLRTWPTDGNRVYPFLSSVDNGWLAAALMVVIEADPWNARLAASINDRMNFRFYFDPTPRDHLDSGAGLLHGGAWGPDGPAPGADVIEDDHLGTGTPVLYTGNYYDTTVSETRIASYIAIARGQVPASHYFATWRTLPSDRDWQEQAPTGETRRYEGVDVVEGTYAYRGMRMVPGWGGSMFEALMPDMFVPEARWAPRSWGVNHPLTVRAHREHGLTEAGYGFWGFSPASQPGGGYREYGVDAIGMNPDGYFSDVEGTNYDSDTSPAPTFGDGVITPHALFLAMHHEPVQAYAGLLKAQRELSVYGDGGFYDAVAVRSGLVARRYLSLDQAMVMGSIGNVFGGEIVRRAFCAGAVRRRIRPLIAQEQFGSGLT